MNEALLISGLRIGTLVALLGGVGALLLSQGWYERHPSTLSEDVDPSRHASAPRLSVTPRPGLTLTWLVTFALTMLFIVMGLPGMGDPGFRVSEFEGWGYPEWSRKGVGGMALLGAIFLLIPRAAFWAAGVLGVIMAGSVATHLVAGQFLRSLMPLLLLGLLGYVAMMRRPGAYGLE